MTSKWVGDAVGKNGIYSVWIAMRNYPWVPPTHYHDKGEIGASIMKPLESLVVIQDEELSVGEMGTFNLVYLTVTSKKLNDIFRPLIKQQRFQWLSCTSRQEARWIHYESKAGTSNWFVERNLYSPCTSSKTTQMAWMDWSARGNAPFQSKTLHCP